MLGFGAQTTQDKAFLVKNLLAGLPSVTRRVAEMRAGRAPGTQAQQVSPGFCS